jgi:type I restriction enzyme M protein
VNHQALSSFTWSVADLLRGDYKQSEYGKVILPFTVLRRLDCVLAASKVEVLAEFESKTKAGLNPDPFLLRKAGQSFYNTSPLDLGKLLKDTLLGPAQLYEALRQKSEGASIQGA